MDITAKVKLNSKIPTNDNQTNLSFGADYADGRNKEWSKYTPILTLGMVVLDSVAEYLEVGQAFTLTFTPNINPERKDNG